MQSVCSSERNALLESAMDRNSARTLCALAVTDSVRYVQARRICRACSVCSRVASGAISQRLCYPLARMTSAATMHGDHAHRARRQRQHKQRSRAGQVRAFVFLQMRSSMAQAHSHVAAPRTERNQTQRRATGVRRALLECVMASRTSEAVVADMVRSLGPIDEAHREAYEATHEVYGTCRMQLACMERSMLERVTSGYECDFWGVLEPVRRVRPSNGGPGWTAELVDELRGLNFELD